MEKWKTLSTTMAFDNPWCRVRKDVVELPSGKVIDDYFVSVRPDVVLVFPITAGGNVIMVRQYKHGVQEILFEFPGGFFEDGELPETAALRELREETGYTTADLQAVGVFYDNPTKDTNKIHLFIARNVVKTAETEFDETEDIEIVELSIKEVLEMIKTQQIRVSGSVALFYTAIRELNL